MTLNPPVTLARPKSHLVRVIPIFFLFCYNINLICACMLDLVVCIRAYVPLLMPRLMCLHSFQLVAHTLGAQILLANSLTLSLMAENLTNRSTYTHFPFSLTDAISPSYHFCTCPANVHMSFLLLPPTHLGSKLT